MAKMAIMRKNYHDTTCHDVEKKQSIAIAYNFCYDRYAKLCHHALKTNAHHGKIKEFCSLQKHGKFSFFHQCMANFVGILFSRNLANFVL